MRLSALAVHGIQRVRRCQSCAVIHRGVRDGGSTCTVLAASAHGPCSPRSGAIVACHHVPCGPVKCCQLHLLAGAWRMPRRRARSRALGRPRAWSAEATPSLLMWLMGTWRCSCTPALRYASSMLLGCFMHILQERGRPSTGCAAVPARPYRFVQCRPSRRCVLKSNASHFRSATLLFD